MGGVLSNTTLSSFTKDKFGASMALVFVSIGVKCLHHRGTISICKFHRQVTSIAGSGSLSVGEKSLILIIRNEECANGHMRFKSHLIDIDPAEEMIYP